MFKALLTRFCIVTTHQEQENHPIKDRSIVRLAITTSCLDLIRETAIAIGGEHRQSMCRTEIAISGDRQTLMLVGPVDAKRPLTMGETGWS